MAISWGSVDPKRKLKSFKKERDWDFGLVRCLDSAKGKLVKIPVLDSACGEIHASFGICLWQHKRTSSQERKAAAEISFLFKKVKRGVWCVWEAATSFERAGCPLKELLIRIILWSFSFLLKRRHLSCLPPAFSVLHENWRESISFQSSRSTNRSRCSRLKASSFGQNVCKGSRQNGSVTLEERVALEVEESGWYTGLIFVLCGGKALVPQGVEEVLLLKWILDGMSRVRVKPCSFPFQLTTNQELMPTRGIRLFN